MVWPVSVVVLENNALTQLLFVGFDFDMTDFECSDGVGGQHFLLSQGHFNQAVGLRSGSGPIEITLALKGGRKRN